MKNTLVAIALATAGLTAIPLTSHAADQSGFFINGNIGESSTSEGLYDDSDVGFGANIGYRWAVTPISATSLSRIAIAASRFPIRSCRAGTSA